MTVAKAQTQPDNEIWYTSSDNQMVTPSNDNFNVSIVSNDYNYGKGVIKFSGELTSIGEFAFNAKTTLASVTIPALVTSIGDEAFNYCTSLESLTFAEDSQLETIGERAFDGAGISGELTLVASLKNIGFLAFAGCPLTKVYMSSENLSGISNKIFIESAVIIVPSALYETYKNHFSGNNKVEMEGIRDSKNRSRHADRKHTFGHGQKHYCNRHQHNRKCNNFRRNIRSLLCGFGTYRPAESI